MSNINEDLIILEILEIESGRFGELVGNPDLDLDDTNGGYVNNKADRGGPTNWGVTEKTLKATGSKTKIKNLTLGEAYTIFRNGYYVMSGADRILDVHPHLARAVCNFAIHAGYNRAVRYLQRILNLQNNKGQLWPDLVEDGVFGLKTMNALKRFMKRRKHRGYSVFMSDYLIRIGAYYQDNVEADEEQETFMFGWSGRVHDLLQEFFLDTQ